MSERTRSPRYTGVAIALHWVMAAMFLVMIWLGLNMEDHQARFQLHKSIGITILTLTIARVIWRLMNPPPKLADDMPAVERHAAHWLHMAFYAVMIVVPLAGWFLASTSQFQVPIVLYGTASWPYLPVPDALRSETIYETVAFLHSRSAWLILGMLALHIAGALKHELVGPEDGVLNRMVPALFGNTDKPTAPARGFLPAFGAASAFFLIIAAIPLIGSGTSQAQPDTPLITDLPQKGSTPLYTTGTTGLAPNWVVDYDTAIIQFNGQHDGKNFSGQFNSWRAQVAFFPDNLDASEVRVEVDLASARTGTKLYDDSLKAAEWFDIKTNNQATVLLTDFKKRDAPPMPLEGEGLPRGDGYDVTATLIMKGQNVSFPMAFNIDIKDGIATMGGQASLKRTPLNLGLSSDPNAEWVSEDIAVTVTGSATRTGP